MRSTLLLRLRHHLNGWQVAGGILAIPATILGLVYSWIQIKQARLKTAKQNAKLKPKEGSVDQWISEHLRAGGKDKPNQKKLLTRFRYVIIGALLAALGLWILYVTMALIWRSAGLPS